MSLSSIQFDTLTVLSADDGNNEEGDDDDDCDADDDDDAGGLRHVLLFARGPRKILRLPR